jgi:hypothetical protein
MDLMNELAQIVKPLTRRNRLALAMGLIKGAESALNEGFLHIAGECLAEAMGHINAAKEMKDE